MSFEEKILTFCSFVKFEVMKVAVKGKIMKKSFHFNLMHLKSL